MSEVLPNIERGFTWSQEYRHLEAVKKKRKEEAGQHLERDVREQWSKGNRGTEGDWR